MVACAANDSEGKVRVIRDVNSKEDEDDFDNGGGVGGRGFFGRI